MTSGFSWADKVYCWLCLEFSLHLHERKSLQSLWREHRALLDEMVSMAVSALLKENMKRGKQTRLDS